MIRCLLLILTAAALTSCGNAPSKSQPASQPIANDPPVLEYIEPTDF